MPASPSRASVGAPSEMSETKSRREASSASRPTTTAGIARRSYAPQYWVSMGFAIFRGDELDWEPRGDETGRTIARLSDSMTQSRANIWRYPPGARGRRHADKVQEEVFVVLDGTLTVDLGEPPERHELERGSVLIVQPGQIFQLRNADEAELVLFIYGAPPVTGGADFYEDVL